MRGIRVLLLAALVGVAALAPGSLGENAERACAGRFSCLGVGLPAPITIAAGRVFGSVTYRIGRDGRVRRIPTPASPFPRGAVWFPGTGTWFIIEGGHLMVGRGRKLVWRSHAEIGARNRLGVIMAGPRGVAFQHDHKLYLAALGGAERPVAHRELPLGWTTGGLYTYRYQGRQLLLRSDTGALVKRIARRPLGSDYQVADGSLYFISRGVLVRAHGARVERLASLNRLGLSAAPWLQPLGRLVELQDDHRLVVVRPDGYVFASTSLPLGHGQAQGISSSLVLAPGAEAVAFTAASARTGDPVAASRAPDTETVYLLRSGGHAAIPLHSEPATFGCGRWASLEWHGRWLLYSSTSGNLAVIDTAGAHRAIALGNRVSRLPGTRDGFSADWSGQATAL